MRGQQLLVVLSINGAGPDQVNSAVSEGWKGQFLQPSFLNILKAVYVSVDRAALRAGRHPLQCPSTN